MTDQLNASFKLAPNVKESAKIQALFKKGVTAEEISHRLRIKLTAVKNHEPKKMEKDRKAAANKRKAAETAQKAQQAKLQKELEAYEAQAQQRLDATEADV